MKAQFKAKLDAIAAEYRQLERRMSALVAEVAKDILADTPELDRFVMAMGSATFHLRDGLITVNDDFGYPEKDPHVVRADAHNSAVYEGDGMFGHIYEKTLPLVQIIDDYDDLFKITGEPMRIFRDGRRDTL